MSMHPKILEVFKRLERERRTGVFRTTSADVRREVFFEAGAIVGALSSSIAERLGELMVRRGRISEQELFDASKLVHARRRRLGDALVELELVTREEVEACVRDQLAEISSKLLTEPSKKLEFKNRSTVGRFTERPVLIADAIIEAARSTNLVEEDLTALLPSDAVPKPTSEAIELMEALNLRSHEAFVLSRCDGESSVKHIFAQIPLSEQETARVLLGLEQAGIIEIRERGVLTGH